MHHTRSRRDMTTVASHFNGWDTMAWDVRAFRYATEREGISRTYGTLSDNNHLTCH